jgi:hypothetical protein
MNVPWETELAELLSSLSAVQDELLELLNEKRDLLAGPDPPRLTAIEPREQQLIAKLEACHDRRAQLLERAAREGLPAENIVALAQALPEAERRKLRPQLQDAKARSRLLHHHSLTNWVLTQRTLIHLSQLLEIIATGGRPEPTYKKGEKPHARGSLMDHAV